MSEVKPISPLLDGFSIGNPISDHDGVRCCPAIKENTDRKYIIKVISVPATQAQMDALLLAGAYKDPADAMEYYRKIGNGLLQEAELLKTLSKLDGFLPYEGWQMEPITRRRLGYEVYLLGSYKRSLEKHLKKHPFTHLEAINLGLDLCAALAICREAGALYVALKPANIFVSEKKEYRICDLGFVQLDALAYTALPEKYHSPYTPPELFDPMAVLDLTVDTYAVGMILYQIYNDGRLPFQGNKRTEDSFPTPCNADYELAEIIMKAIDPEPAQRWTNPSELGKALASYMQRNSINDVPITPHTPLEIQPEESILLSEEENTPTEEDVALLPALDTLEADPEVSSFSAEEPVTEVQEVSLGAQDPADEENAADSDAAADFPSASSAESEMPESPPEPEHPLEESQLSDSISPEATEILSKADDLIAYEAPEDIRFPEVQEEDPFAFAAEDSEDLEEMALPEETEVSEDPVMPPANVKEKRKSKRKFADPKYKRRLKRFLLSVVLLLVLSIAGMLGYVYYQTIYLLPIGGLHITGGQDRITVSVDTAADPSLLKISCADPFGKTFTEILTEKEVTFAGLQPNTVYTVQLDAEGFHKLSGETSGIFTTDSSTMISGFSSIAGTEDGSVILSFHAEGEEPRDWSVYYHTEGEQEKRRSFTGHSVTISGLTTGKYYTFRLDPGEHISLGGQTTLEVLASKLIVAENLTVTSDNGTDVTISWRAPGDVVVESWDVRFYNDAGQEETVTVTDTQAVFTIQDPAAIYSAEVTAAGMTVCASTSITSDPLNITQWKVDDSSYKKLKLSWEFTGTAPKNGWILRYSIPGSEETVISCKKASAEIAPKIPGAKYNITLEAADERTIFNASHSHTVAEGASFDKHALLAESLSVHMLKTPEQEPWYYEHTKSEDLTDTFPSGSKVSLVLLSKDTFYMTGAEVEILYVFQDSFGNVLPQHVCSDTMQWKNIWNGGDPKNGELDIPSVPKTPGDYLLKLYFDGMVAAEIPFTITK